jgi:predicted lipoprotein with Yx(FWY)xxD motif
VKIRHALMLAAPALVVATLAPPAGSAPTGPTAKRAPAIKITVSGFGNVLATRGRKALYYWNVEKRGFRVRCTGACARAWPPLVVRSRASVPKRVKGIRGTFGVIRRPDGRLQVTHNRLPIYTYAHERPNQVLCDNVDGWFVVRV